MLRSYSIFMVLILGTAAAFGQKPHETSRTTTTAAQLIGGTPQRTILNINNFTTWLAANTNSNNPPSLAGYGGFYPRGTRWVIYQDGLIWGGKCFTNDSLTAQPDSQLVRVGGSTLRSGMIPGALLGNGETAIAENPVASHVRVFRIRRDYMEMSDAELARDAAEFNEIPQINATDAQKIFIQNQYNLDWKDWPVTKGGPYIERNGIPGYQPPPEFNSLFTAESLVTQNHDEPGIAGIDPDAPADQVIWTVANDLNPFQSRELYGAEPMGIELQVTRWGYKSADALGQTYFTRYRLINKGGVDTGIGKKGSFFVDSMFVGQWSDPDIGLYTDDLAGCDSVLGIGFAYSSRQEDVVFSQFGLPPPAVSYDILSGPTVPGLPTDTAWFDSRKVPGRTNLRMTSFGYGGSGTGFTGDPPPREYESAVAVWKWLRGFRQDTLPGPDLLYPHPPGITPGKFPLSGNPVSGYGFIDGAGTAWSFPPNDRRFLMGCGPFQFFPGDTQDVVIATIAGLGGDNRSSISVMKYNDKVIKLAFQTGFNIPRIEKPAVRIAELDREIVLEWQRPVPVSSNPYEFEGYVCYQLANESQAAGKRVVGTFDRVDGIQEVVDEQYNSEFGRMLMTIVKHGSDSGVRHSIRITQDAWSGEPLRNGQKYFFAITAYSYTADSRYPRTIESDIELIRAIPRIPFGLRGNLQYGDTISVTHAQGFGTGRVVPTVVNPLTSTGHAYEVRFDSSGGSTRWSLHNVTLGTDIVAAQPLHTGSDQPPIVEGAVSLAVFGAHTPNDVFSFSLPAIDSSLSAKKQSARTVNVYPNPAIAVNRVTFSHLPPKAVIRIFNLAGHHVRTIEKNDPSQFLSWDLTNDHNWQMASGIYLCYIEMQEVGETVLLKLAIVQEQLYPNVR